MVTRSVGPARRTYFLEPKAQTGSKGTLLICAPVEIRSGMFDPQVETEFRRINFLWKAGPWDHLHILAASKTLTRGL